MAGGQAKLFQPTAKQMASIRKTLGGEKPQAKKVKKALLPAGFDGWARGGARAVQPKAGNAAALKEFGFKRGEAADYSRGGAQVAVRVLEFPDATGSYGAFTMLRAAGMKRLRIGPGLFEGVVGKAGKKGKPAHVAPPPLTFWNGAEAGGEYLFWKGNLLVEARFAEPVADGMGVVMRLAKVLPEMMGPNGTPPSLPEQLPLKGLERGSVRYAIGPLGYAREGGVLPPAVLDFNTDAEVVMAQYGKGMLTVISYPTPEIALAREAAIASVLKSGMVAGPKDALRVKRAGPLVALTSGSFTAAEADGLLRQVKFEGTVTIDQVKPEESEVAKTAKLLVGIATLTVILGLASILLGFFLGGGRALYRVMRGKPASSLSDEEFIALDLNKAQAVREDPGKDGPARG